MKPNNLGINCVNLCNNLECCITQDCNDDGNALGLNVTPDAGVNSQNNIPKDTLDGIPNIISGTE